MRLQLLKQEFKVLLGAPVPMGEPIPSDIFEDLPEGIWNEQSDLSTNIRNISTHIGTRNKKSVDICRVGINEGETFTATQRILVE